MTLAVRTGCLWGVAVLLAGLSGCGSSASKCGTNCKTDGAADQKQQVDAALDHAPEQDTGTVEKHDAQADAPEDAQGSVDAANACDQSVSAACAASATHDGGAFSLHCASTWSETTSNAYLCGRPEILLETCGESRELIDTSNTGTSEYIYVYDGAGALTAILYTMGATSHCVAGPATFTEPAGCGGPQLFSCATDGGRHG